MFKIIDLGVSVLPMVPKARSTKQVRFLFSILR